MCNQLSLIDKFKKTCGLCHGEGKYLYIHCEDNDDIYLECPCCEGQGKVLDVHREESD